MASPIVRAFPPTKFNMAGTTFAEGTISVGTSATLIPLGGVTQPHWAYFANRDGANYVTLFNGATGAVFARLYAGEAAYVPLDPGCVPYAQANGAPCSLEYLVISL
jgi:hypothetical protein